MIYLFLAEGFEEVEAVTTIDYLRRSNLSVVTVGVGGKNITGTHGITVTADIEDTQVILNDELDGVILPGGMPGTINLERSAIVQKTVDYCADNNRLLAAICAAPSILGHKGLLKDLNATCFPGMETECEESKMQYKPACCDKNIITGMAAGAATQFSAEIVKYFKGEDQAEKLLEEIKWVI